jgi:hypothetical protein
VALHFYGDQEFLTQKTLKPTAFSSLANPASNVINSEPARIRPGTMLRNSDFLRFQRVAAKGARKGRFVCRLSIPRQISRITGMIKGRRLVLFWIYRFKSLRIFSLITP